MDNAIIGIGIAAAVVCIIYIIIKDLKKKPNTSSKPGGYGEGESPSKPVR